MMEVRFHTGKDFEPVDTEEKWLAVRAAQDAYWAAVKKLSMTVPPTLQLELPLPEDTRPKVAAGPKRREPTRRGTTGAAAPVGQRVQDYAEKALRTNGRPLDEEELTRAMEIAGCTKMSPVYARLIAPILSKDPLFARQGGRWALAEWEAKLGR